MVRGFRAPEPAGGRHRGLPRRAARPVRQPAHAPPPGPDRRGRLAEAADPLLPVVRRGARGGPRSRRRDARARRLGVPPPRARRAGQRRARRRGRPARDRTAPRSRRPDPGRPRSRRSPRTTTSRRPCAPTPRSSSVKAGRDAGAPCRGHRRTGHRDHRRQGSGLRGGAPWQRVAIREYPLLQPAAGLAGAGPRGDHGRGGPCPGRVRRSHERRCGGGHFAEHGDARAHRARSRDASAHAAGHLGRLTGARRGASAARVRTGAASCTAQRGHRCIR